ncbi:TPA: hypothetical protein ACK3JR_000109 [Mannheimia haemolytica]
MAIIGKMGFGFGKIKVKTSGQFGANFANIDSSFLRLAEKSHLQIFQRKTPLEIQFQTVFYPISSAIILTIIIPLFHHLSVWQAVNAV